MDCIVDTNVQMVRINQYEDCSDCCGLYAWSLVAGTPNG